jgi:hypothetical protein
MLAKKLYLLALILMAVTFGANRARAESGNASDEAVRLGHQGLTHYEAADWEAALQQFERANQTAFSPVFVLYMARCQHNLGRLIEAVRLLDELLTRELEPDAPTSWRNAFRDARAELGLIRGRIPSLRITGSALAQATIDGRPAPINEPIELNPGDYLVRGWSKSGDITLRRVTLVEGQRSAIINLSAEIAPIAPGTPSTEHLHVDRAPRQRYRTAAWIAGGAAVAAALVGSVTGLVALSKANAVRSRCDDNLCAPELAANAEEARNLANVSTAAFAIAGADLAIGITFLLLPE